MSVYRTTVTKVGPQVPDFIATGLLVLFAEGAPEELHAFSVLHQPDPISRPVRAGDRLVLPADEYTVTAIGDVANKNLEALGHGVFKANGRTEPDLPGDICIEQKPLPAIDVGMEIRIEGATDA
jgi:PTS system glucitol/sorbitol-specific IIA component